MIITFFVIHTVGFSGTIPFILNSELFPLQIRGSLAGVATAVNWGCSALVSTAYAPFANLVSIYCLVGVWYRQSNINRVCCCVSARDKRRKTRGDRTLSAEEIQTVSMEADEL